MGSDKDHRAPPADVYVAGRADWIKLPFQWLAPALRRRGFLVAAKEANSAFDQDKARRITHSRKLCARYILPESSCQGFCFPSLEPLPDRASRREYDRTSDTR